MTVGPLRVRNWPKAEPVLVDGRTLAVRQLSTGDPSSPAPADASELTPPLLLLHGLRATGHQWKRLLGQLPPHRRLLVPDLPGFADSEDRGEYTLSAVATTLAALVEQEAGGPVDVIGHDWGATLAIALCALRPDLVRRLAVIAGMWPPSLASGPDHPASGMGRRLQRIEAGPARGSCVARAYLQPDPALQGVPTPERSLVIWGTTPRLSLPGSGVQARRLSPRYGEKVVSALGRGVDPATVDMVTIPGGGYLPHLAKPHVLGPVLCDFLTS